MAKIKKIKLPNDTSAREVYDNGAVRFDEKGNLTEAQKAYIRPFKEMGYTFGDLFDMTWEEDDEEFN